jgi:crotonobetainyl-CoA:carnitine CoA-transferase CaiB-like acyl-CoA transferase
MRQALEGIRVVEITAGMAGPWIGRFMAYCGAEVIKIESRDHPDVTRLYVPPRQPELGVQSQLSPWFTDWNAGKRFVALDLTKPEAVRLAGRLAAAADVVIENYSAGVVEKLGLGYDTLRALRPDLVMLASSGYGDDGPCRRYVTWGPNIEALSGLATLSGFPERECTITQYAYPDPLSALHGLVAVMCALDHRLRTGRGQYINLSQYEATVSAIGHVLLERLVNGIEPARRGNRALDAAPHGCYRCAGEDRWCAISIATESEWERFCAATDHPEWQRDPRFADLPARLAHVDALDRLVETWTGARPDSEVMATLQGAGLAAGVVQTVEDEHRDPQLAARAFFEKIPHARKGTVTATGIPLGLTGTPGRTPHTGAALGQDNAYVFGEILGMPGEEIERLIAAGIIQTPGEDG